MRQDASADEVTGRRAFNRFFYFKALALFLSEQRSGMIHSWPLLKFVKIYPEILLQGWLQIQLLCKIDRNVFFCIVMKTSILNVQKDQMG